MLSSETERQIRREWERRAETWDFPSESYALYHGAVIKAHSGSLDWVRNDARRFHDSAHAEDVFILPME